LHNWYLWIQGPYHAGKYNDVNFFNKVLHHFLKRGERWTKIKCPGKDANLAENCAMDVMVRV
jgi:hypothetical protein